MKKGKVSMKRALSMILALVMILAMFPAVAFAAGSTPKLLYVQYGQSWFPTGATLGAYFFNNATGAYAWATVRNENKDNIYLVEVPESSFAYSASIPFRICPRPR